MKSMENAAGPAGSQPAFDPSVQAFINSIEVERHRNQAVLTATIPAGLMQRMMDTPQDLRKMGVPEGGKDSGKTPAQSALEYPERPRAHQESTAWSRVELNPRDRAKRGSRIVPNPTWRKHAEVFRFSGTAGPDAAAGGEPGVCRRTAWQGADRAAGVHQLLRRAPRSAAGI